MRSVVVVVVVVVPSLAQPTKNTAVNASITNGISLVFMPLVRALTDIRPRRIRVFYAIGGNLGPIRIFRVQRSCDSGGCVVREQESEQT